MLTLEVAAFGFACLCFVAFVLYRITPIDSFAERASIALLVVTAAGAVVALAMIGTRDTTCETFRFNDGYEVQVCNKDTRESRENEAREQHRDHIATPTPVPTAIPLSDE